MKRLMSRMTSSLVGLSAVTLIAAALPCTVLAQGEGGLYIAGYRFIFEQAAEQGLARNPGDQRFFVLALPPNTAALTTAAPQSATAVRDRVVASGVVAFRLPARHRQTPGWPAPTAICPTLATRQPNSRATMSTVPC